MMWKYSSILLGGLLAAGSLAAENFDRGGVTFPMEKISAERFAAAKADNAANLLKNSDLSAPLIRSAADGWSYSTWIFGPENREKFDKEAKETGSGKIIDTESGKVLELDRPLALENLMGEQSDKFTNAFNQIVKLPDENGGSYRLTFDHRSQVIGKNRSAQMVLLNFYDAGDLRPGRGKATRTYLNSKIDMAPEWHPYSFEFTAPPKTRDLAIAIRADGCGKIQIKNPQLVKLDAAAAPLTVEFAPGKLLDNTFVLASGDPGIIAFKFKNNQPQGTMAVKKATLNLELPDGISVDGTNIFLGKEIRSTEIVVDGKKWRRWELDVNNSILGSIRNRQDFNGYNIVTAMISGDVPAGTAWDGCHYYLTENGQAVSGVEAFSLKMMPSLPKITAPKQFYAGFSSAANDIRLQQPEMEKRFAGFIGKSGSTMINSNIPPEYIGYLRESGVRLATSECYGIANGFRIGLMDEKKKPEYSKYLDKDGKTVKNHSHPATCPMAIYNRTQYYKDIVLPLLTNTLKGKDGLMPNWEPYSFINKGCFCDNCREEFAKFAGLTQEKAKELWPQQLQPGYPYRDQAIRFRAYQHARMIKTLHEDTLALGSTEVGFCPEVGTDQIIRYPNSFKEQWEFTPYEYAGDLKWLNVWGPYAWFIADQPYAYDKGTNLITWEMAKRVIRDYRTHFSDPGKRAKLVAMPHGIQLGLTALAQPEGMAMDQISSFLAGYDASILYYFPRGYDHRFWKAFADSTALIAANEDLVMNGKPVDNITAAPQSPFPAPCENIEPKFLPDARSTELLQVAAFEKDGRILVVVGNFWEKGDVVFKLSIPGLKTGSEYSVREKAFDRHYVQADGKFFTGKMLTDGILLHAGAQRWVFFEIAPAAKLSEKAVTAAEMQKELERCRKDNQPAADAEAARDKALNAENDIGELKTLNSGALSCKPVQQDGQTLLEITAGDNTMSLNPRGMALKSWRVGKIEYVDSQFGLSAFWTPGKHGMPVNYNFRFTDQRITQDGLTVTGEFTTTVRSYPQLSGLKIVKTLRISPDLKQISLTAELHNTQATAMNDIGYRWSFIPTAWNNLNKGAMEYDSGKVLNRPNDYTLLAANCDPASEEIIRRLFQVKSPTLKISGNQFRFTAPGMDVMEARLEPASEFGGVAIWDTTRMIAPTFEPFYRPTLIAPGENVTFSASFSLK